MYKYSILSLISEFSQPNNIFKREGKQGWSHSIKLKKPNENTSVNCTHLNQKINGARGTITEFRRAAHPFRPAPRACTSGAGRLRDASRGCKSGAAALGDPRGVPGVCPRGLRAGRASRL